MPRYKSLIRMENIPAGGGESDVLEAGVIVAEDNPFVKLHPAQFEVLADEPTAPVEEAKVKSGKSAKA